MASSQAGTRLPRPSAAVSVGRAGAWVIVGSPAQALGYPGRISGVAVPGKRWSATSETAPSPKEQPVTSTLGTRQEPAPVHRLPRPRARPATDEPAPSVLVRRTACRPARASC